MSEEELIAHGNIAPALHSLGRTKVARLSKTLAMKFGPTVLSSEAETMKHIAAEFPAVRLPPVHRYFTIGHSLTDSDGYIVMDYIDSPSLDTCWDELSLDFQESVVEQIAAIVDQLQSLHYDQPGVLGGGMSRGKFFGLYGAGPFPTKEIFEKWISWKLYLCKRYQRALQDTLLLQCPYFVLVHGDLSPRNLVLDTSNQVWLIDWGCAGFYPPIFEAASAKYQTDFDSFSRLLLPLIYNNSEELAQLDACSFGINRVSHSLPPEMEFESEQ